MFALGYANTENVSYFLNSVLKWPYPHQPDPTVHIHVALNQFQMNVFIKHNAVFADLIEQLTQSDIIDIIFYEYIVCYIVSPLLLA